MTLVAQRTVRDLCHAARLDWNRTYREQSTRDLSNLFDVVSLFGTVDTNSRPHHLYHLGQKGASVSCAIPEQLGYRRARQTISPEQEEAYEKTARTHGSR